MWFFAMSWLAGCRGDETGAPAGGPSPPLGMVLADDGRIYAGVATIDLTPEIRETFDDANANFTFDAGEAFDDADGDGVFDAVWIGGFGPLRPAQGVHDPITARALVLSAGGEYLAIVALDLVGLGSPRISAAGELLAVDGFDPDRLLVSSSHNHQGPDTMGLWGNPVLGVTGRDEAYQQRVTAAIAEGVRAAAASMEAVEVAIGAVRTRDLSPWFNGADWGGKNPVAKTHGLIYDGRDPVVISDQLLVLQGTGEGGVAFTLTNWSGHPEVRGSDNDQLSADWIGALRVALEATFGGTALHVPESLGGMQSALHADLPLVLDDGTHVFQVCDAVAVADPADPDCFGLAAGSDRIDADGDRVPVWAAQDSWEFVTSHGWHLAEAAIAALAAGEPLEATGIRVDREPIYVPVENVAYQILGPQGLFDLDFDDVVTDPALCPDVVADPTLGCLRTVTSRVEIGQLTWSTVPGELLPELAWGFPDDDPRWTAEAASVALRGAERGAVYFPQHTSACDDTAYAECQQELAIDTCDCLAVHAAPYRLSDDPSVAPILAPVQTEYRAIVGMAGDYLSYIIPEPDFNHAVSLFTDDGDHYEDTVSPAHNFATRVLEGQARIDDRW